MGAEIIEHNKNYKGFPGCTKLYRFFVWAGNKLYVLSEKCAWYSKDRQRKIELDEEWNKKVFVGDMVLSNEHLSEEILETDEIKVTCKETVEELGGTYMELKEQLGLAHDVIYRLWVAHTQNDRVAAEKIFKEIGLEGELI